MHIGSITGALVSKLLSRFDTTRPITPATQPAKTPPAALTPLASDELDQVVGGANRRGSPNNSW
jgi:hypothetical protein